MAGHSNVADYIAVPDPAQDQVFEPYDTAEVTF